MSVDSERGRQATDRSEVAQGVRDLITSGLFEVAPGHAFEPYGFAKLLPAGTPVDVTISNLAGTDVRPAAYTFIPEPELFSADTVTPNCGNDTTPPGSLPVTQGQRVILQGDDFVGPENVILVTVGGSPASFTVTSDSQIQVAMPLTPAGGPRFDLLALLITCTTPVSY